MSFPFPTNPVDGQVATHLASDGTVLTATYHAAKNEWHVSREAKAGTVVTSPQQFDVSPTHDQQVIVWDATAGKWIAQQTPVRLRELRDVEQHATPTHGDMPIWSYAKGHPETGKFQWATPPAHIKNWDSTVHWESGSAVYYHGQLWRATRENVNVEPKVEAGRTQLYIHVDGEPTFGILPTDITSTPPPAGNQPQAFKLSYWLQYTNDQSMVVWKWVMKGLDPGTHRPYGEWEARPWTCIAWRNINPPGNRVPPGLVVVWIRAEPGSTVAPIKGQQDWATLEVTNYLSVCADVATPSPVNHDVLLYDAASHKWTETRLSDLANLLKPFLSQTTP